MAGRGGGRLVHLERDAEVGQRRVAAAVHDDVGGFHVTVQDARFVRHFEGGQQRQPDPGHQIRRQRTVFLDDAFQRPAGQQVHDDPRPVVGGEYVVHRNNPSMVQPGAEPGLPKQPAKAVLPLGLGQPGRQVHLFEGDLAVEYVIVGTPDGAHPASPDPGDQPITATD
nr:hypothetical protein [Fodinicola feengrottensis]